MNNEKKYKYIALNIYKGEYMCFKSNVLYKKHEIVNGEYDIQEGYHINGWSIY